MLVRFFSLSQWNHLTFLVLGVALLGFSASGVVLAVLVSRGPRAAAVLRRPAGIAVLLAGLSLGVLGSFAALRAMELDYFRIPLELGQLALLAVSFLVLSVPFAIAGLVTALAYADPDIPAGRTYLAAMAGSGLGAVAPVGLLPAFGIAGAVAAIAGVPALLAVATAGRRGGSGRWMGSALAGAAAAAVAIGSLATGLIGEVTPSSYKLGYQALQFPETEVVERRTTIRGRYERLQGPALRFAPGLSLRWMERFPRQDALLTDGDASLFVPRDPDPRYAGDLLGSVGAALVSDAGTALVLQASGGNRACRSSSRPGVPRITVVDPSAWRAAAVRAAVAELGWDGPVSVRRSSLRGFTARAR